MIEQADVSQTCVLKGRTTLRNVDKVDLFRPVVAATRGA